MFDENNTAVTPNVESTPVSEQTADVQAQESTPNALEQFIAGDSIEAADEQSDTVEATEHTEQTHESASEDEVPKSLKGRLNKAEAKGETRGYERAKSEWATKEADYLRRLAEYEAKEAEAEIESAAQAIRKREGCSIDFARRIARYERSIGSNDATPEKVTPSKTERIVLSDERRSMLSTQVSEIKDEYGIDVLPMVTDEEASAILEGKMDLWRVAMRSLKSSEAGSKKSAPIPVKTGGSSSVSPGGLDFSNMSDEQFDSFQARIRGGAVYKPPR